jgi:5-methylcytosine-specific restriction enzyme B
MSMNVRSLLMIDKSTLLNRVKDEIKKGNYYIGDRTPYIIITVKVDNNNYYVFFIANEKVIGPIEEHGQLAAAKKRGVRIYKQYVKHENFDVSNLSMYHYKHDRPNGHPWQKDSQDVIKRLLEYKNYHNINNEEIERNIGMSNQQAQNIILYGPPGTGKTYQTTYKSLELIDPQIDKDLLENPSRRAEAINLFNEYVEKNQIMFCTFHQSFSYEEFVEGYRFIPEKEGYEVKDGIFKTICNAAKPKTTERQTTYSFDVNEINFFKMSLGYIHDSREENIFEYCIENNVIALGYGGELDYTDCKERVEIEEKLRAKYPKETPFAIDAVQRFRNWMKKDDLVIISNGNTKARGIGRITGDYFYNPDTPIDYKHFRSVEWLYSNTELPVENILKGKRFSQQSIYMFGKEDINVESLRGLLTDLDDDVEDELQYVLIIDEINRGNVSKVFGELITLIEPDKRKGCKNEINVTLPYSGEKFSVPKNLHILGTMNTADRSIALLDTALRRRFKFIEIMPDYSLLPTSVNGVNIQLLLKSLNDRIEYLYDRDHVLGHALFLGGEFDEENFYINVISERVIPLLQEYFYDNWELIEQVLGGSGNKGDSDLFLWKEEMDSVRLFGKTVNGHGKTRYTLNPHPSKNALTQIYKNYQTDDDEE